MATVKSTLIDVLARRIVANRAELDATPAEVTATILAPEFIPQGREAFQNLSEDTAAVPPRRSPTDLSPNELAAEVRRQAAQVKELAVANAASG